MTEVWQKNDNAHTRARARKHTHKIQLERYRRILYIPSRTHTLSKRSICIKAMKAVFFCIVCWKLVSVDCLPNFICCLFYWLIGDDRSRKWFGTNERTNEYCQRSRTIHIRQTINLYDTALTIHWNFASNVFGVSFSLNAMGTWGVRLMPVDKIKSNVVFKSFIAFVISDRKIFVSRSIF